MKISSSLELSMKFLKGGETIFDPSLRKFHVKSSLAHHVLEPILKVG